MGLANSDEGGRLRRLQNERDEVERQKDRVREELRETTNKYLTALAAVHSAQRMIGVYGGSAACGAVHYFAGLPGMHAQLETPRDVEIPSHVEDAVDTVEGGSDDEDDNAECSPGYWCREETAVAAITEGEEVVFRVSDQESLERLHEEAEAKRQQLYLEVRKRHEKHEQLKAAHHRREDSISKVFGDETEPTGEPLAAEVKRSRLRGIAEQHPDQIEAVRDYLDERPERVWPEFRTEVFRSVFPNQEARKVLQRFRNWWKRSDLKFPDTVEDLHVECKTGLKLRDEFPVEST
jgi:hypothetical protein